MGGLVATKTSLKLVISFVIRVNKMDFGPRVSASYSFNDRSVIHVYERSPLQFCRKVFHLTNNALLVQPD